MKIYLFLTLLAPLCGLFAAGITHGPVLGRPGSDTMTVWARTDVPGEIQVRYGLSEAALDQTSEAVATELFDDCTGTVTLSGLQPATRYFYEVFSDEGVAPRGSFKTLADPSKLIDEVHNPKGLFNFKFEFGCGNNQKSAGGGGLPLRTYQTLLREHRDEVDFAILNGDWLYEEKRDYPLDEWLLDVRTEAAEQPRITQLAPTITGLWENYKIYHERSPELREWHRHVPSFYTIDDHEIVNDVCGCATAGYQNRRTVFRDIAVKGWVDYLAWSNPVEHAGLAHFGKAALQKESDILVDPKAKFTALPLDEMANLHIHFGTADAGVMDPEPDPASGDPNFGNYDIVEVISDTELRLDRPLKADTSSTYSIGRRIYGSFEVANCEFFILDTRSHRDLHTFDTPENPETSMLGKQQMEWLIDGLTESTADFRFIISSVNFMIPHVGSGGGADAIDGLKKDDAWTVFLHDRERLINHAKDSGKQTFVLTGDLHNSFAVKIEDNVWEFASGPHNSVNHVPENDEAGRPANGPFQYGPRPCEVRWSSYAMADMERLDRIFPHYCVVDIRNVFNQPQTVGGGDRWVAWPKPYVMFHYHHGLTGDLVYTETIHATGQE